jgi:hypothetical protein
MKERAAMGREALHDLVNRIPEHDLAAAQRYLEYLATSPAYRAAMSAPPDDEPVTAGDSEAIERAVGEIRTGNVVSHDAILSEFGLR